MIEIIKNDRVDMCSQCREKPIYLAGFAMFFPGRNYNPNACYLCPDCLREALAMIEIREMTDQADANRSGQAV